MPPPSLTEAHPPLPLDELVAGVQGFQTSSTPDKQAFIRELVSYHPILSVNWGGKWRYRRARVLDVVMVPATVDELIWRKGVPAALGRANPAGFQVLYLADRLDTAFSEKHVTNNPAVLTEFSIIPSRSIQIAPIGELTRIQRTGRGFLTGDASPTLSDILNACGRDEATSLLIADAFLLDCLTNPDDDYEISSCVAMSIFDKFASVSAVAYPSQRQLGAINFAVRVEKFWEDWGVCSVRRGRAVHLAQGYHRFTGIRHVNGITHNGSLKWDTQVSADYSVALLDPLWTPNVVT